MNNSDSDDLLSRARNFDLDALEEMYNIYSPGLYNYAIRLLGDAERAEECVAETFSRLLVALKAGKGPRDYLKAYLYRIAHNWITDQFLIEHKRTIELDESNSPVVHYDAEKEISDHLNQERVRSALRALTSDQRQIVMLKYFEYWENEEIAKSLQKPIGAVKSLQHRALQSLKRLLVRNDEESL